MKTPPPSPRTPPEDPKESKPDQRSTKDLQELWMRSFLSDFPELSRAPVKATVISGSRAAARNLEQQLEFKIAWLRAELADAEKELEELKQQQKAGGADPNPKGPEGPQSSK